MPVLSAIASSLGAGLQHIVLANGIAFAHRCTFIKNNRGKGIYKDYTDKELSIVATELYPSNSPNLYSNLKIHNLRKHLTQLYYATTLDLRVDAVVSILELHGAYWVDVDFLYNSISKLINIFDFGSYHTSEQLPQADTEPAKIGDDPGLFDKIKNYLSELGLQKYITQFSNLPYISAGIVCMLSTVYFLLCNETKISNLSIESMPVHILELITKTASNWTNLQRGIEGFYKMFQTISNFIGNALGFDMTSMDPRKSKLGSELSEITKTFAEIQQIIVKEPEKLLVTDRKFVDLEKALFRLDEHYQKLLLQDVNLASFKVVYDDLRERVKLIRETVQSVVRSTGYRQHPTIVFFVGEPGIGKSTYVSDRFHKKLAEKHGHALAVAARTKDKYFSTYAYQPIIHYDDFNADRDDPYDHLELLNFASEAAWPVSKAEVEGKGIPCVSIYGTYCMNQPFVYQSPLNSIDALHRRMEFKVICHNPKIDEWMRNNANLKRAPAPTEINWDDKECPLEFFLVNPRIQPSEFDEKSQVKITEEDLVNMVYDRQCEYARRYKVKLQQGMDFQEMLRKVQEDIKNAVDPINLPQKQQDLDPIPDDPGMVPECIDYFYIDKIENKMKEKYPELDKITGYYADLEKYYQKVMSKYAENEPVGIDVYSHIFVEHRKYEERMRRASSGHTYKWFYSSTDYEKLKRYLILNRFDFCEGLHKHRVSLLDVYKGASYLDTVRPEYVLVPLPQDGKHHIRVSEHYSILYFDGDCLRCTSPSWFNLFLEAPKVPFTHVSYCETKTFEAIVVHALNTGKMHTLLPERMFALLSLMVPPNSSDQTRAQYENFASVCGAFLKTTTVPTTIVLKDAVFRWSIGPTGLPTFDGYTHKVSMAHTMNMSHMATLIADEIDMAITDVEGISDIVSDEPGLARVFKWAADAFLMMGQMHASSYGLSAFTSMLHKGMKKPVYDDDGFRTTQEWEVSPGNEKTVPKQKPVRAPHYFSSRQRWEANASEILNLRTGFMKSKTLPQFDISLTAAQKTENYFTRKIKQLYARVVGSDVTQFEKDVVFPMDEVAQNKEEMYDPNAMDIMQKVNGNQVDILNAVTMIENVDGTYRTAVDVERFRCSALMLQGHLGVTVAHVNTKPWIVKYKGVEYSPTILAENTKYDVLVFTLPIQCELFPDITNHIQKETDLKLEKGTNSCLLTKLKLKNMWMIRFVQLDCFITKDPPPGTQPGINYTGCLDNYNIKVPVGTVPGDCGSAVIVQDRTRDRKIIGLHKAANLQRGSAVPLYLELIAQFLPQSPQSVMDDIFHQTMVRPLTSEKVDLYEPEDVFVNSKVIGKLQEKVVTPPKTNIFRSALQTNMFGDNYEPAALGVEDSRLPQGLTHPIKYAGIVKWDHTPPKNINFRLLQTVKEDTKRFITQVFRRNRVVLQRLTKREAINRKPIYIKSHSLNRSSSAGYPWKLKCGEGKHDYLSYDEEKQIHYIAKNRLGWELNNAIDYLADSARRKVLTAPVYIASLKDEPVALKKIYLEPKTRGFAACPLHLLIPLRQYYHTLMATFVELFNEFPWKVGMNPLTSDFDTMYRQLRSKGYKAFDGDYKDWDATVVREFMVALYEIYADLIEEFIDMSTVREDTLEEHMNIVRVLSHYVTHPFVSIDEFVVTFPGGQMSGQPHTAIDNSIINFMYFYYAWLHLAPKDMQDFSAFQTHVGLAIFGDDNTATVSDEVAEFFNLQTLIPFFQDALNVKMQPGDKSTTVYKYKSLDETTFLRRTPVEFHGLYLGALLPEVFDKMLNWTHGKGKYLPEECQSHFCYETETMEATTLSCLGEIFLYGKETYDVVAAHCQGVLDSPQVHSELILPSYEQMVEKVLWSIYPKVLDPTDNQRLAPLLVQQTYQCSEMAHVQPPAGSGEVYGGTTPAATMPPAAFATQGPPSMEIPIHTGSTNAFDPYFFEQYIQINTITWNTSDPPGKVLWSQAIHPSAHPYINYFSKAYYGWGGGFDYMFKAAGTGFHAGNLCVSRLPPGISPTAISNPTSFSVFESTYIDPKCLEVVSRTVMDQRNVMYHVKDSVDYSNHQTYGGTIVVWVSLRLNTSSSGVNQIDIGAWIKPSPTFTLSQIVPLDYNMGGSTPYQELNDALDFTKIRNRKIVGVPLPATKFIIHPDSFKIMNRGVFGMVDIHGKFADKTGEDESFWYQIDMPLQPVMQSEGLFVEDTDHKIATFKDQTIPWLIPAVGLDVSVSSFNVGNASEPTDKSLAVKIVATNRVVKTGTEVVPTFKATTTALATGDTAPRIGFTFYGNDQDTVEDFGIAMAKAWSPLDVAQGFTLPLDESFVGFGFTDLAPDKMYWMNQPSSLRDLFIDTNIGSNLTSTQCLLCMVYDTQYQTNLTQVKIYPTGVMSAPKSTNIVTYDLTHLQIRFYSVIQATESFPSHNQVTALNRSQNNAPRRFR
jgi:hypothetical protein